MAGAIVLVIGDIRKLATETIQFGSGRILVNSQMISVRRRALDNYRSHLEQVGSGRVRHAESWHVLGIRGGWGVGMIGLISPLYIPMFVGPLHLVYTLTR
jgi:hypothetical protein